MIISINVYHLLWILVIVLGVFIKELFNSKSAVFNVGFIIGLISNVILEIAIRR